MYRGVTIIGVRLVDLCPTDFGRYEKRTNTILKNPVTEAWTLEFESTPLIPKLLSEITKKDLLQLVENSIIEGKTIEFKQELKQSTDGDKRELLADVSSFANAGGGDLIYGIAAKEGVASEVRGLDAFNEDQDVLRLESILRDGIEPRIQGLQIHVVKGDDGTSLIIRVPRSWSSPHMVTFKGSSRFFTRSTAGKYQMDVSELRSAFENSGQLTKQIEEWRLERVARIIANEGPALLRPPIENHQGACILHIVPLSSFHDWNKLDAAQFNGTMFPPLDSGGWDHHVNLDGFLTFSRAGRLEERIVSSYTQAFRNGAIESVAANTFSVVNGQLYIAPSWLEKTVFEALDAYSRSCSTLGIDPPYVVMLTLHGVKAAAIYTETRRFYSPSRIGIDTLFIPPEIMQSLAQQPDNDPALRHLFDRVWNAGGYTQSLNYDDSGNWTGGR